MQFPDVQQICRSFVAAPANSGLESSTADCRPPDGVPGTQYQGTRCTCRGTLCSRCSSVPTSTLSFWNTVNGRLNRIKILGTEQWVQRLDDTSLKSAGFKDFECKVGKSTVVQCGAVWCNVVQCGAMWCTVVQCGARLSTYLLHPVLAEKIAQGSFGVENPNIL